MHPVGQSASTSSVCSPSAGTGTRRTGDVTSEKLTGPLTDRCTVPFAAFDVDEPVVGQQLRVLDHLGRRLRRRPPHPLAVEALGPLGQRPLGDDLVEEGDDLGPVAADGRGVGEARSSSSRSGRPRARQTAAMWRSASRPVKKNQRPSSVRYGFISGAWFGRRGSAPATLPSVICRPRSHPST